MVAPLVAPDRLTLKVSLGSTLVSPLIVTEKVCEFVGAELQRVGARDVVAVGGGGGAVGRGIVDVERRRAAGAGDREGRDLGAGVALDDQ